MRATVQSWACGEKVLRVAFDAVAAEWLEAGRLVFASGDGRRGRGLNGRSLPAGLVALGIACASVCAAGYLTRLPIGDPRLRASVVRHIEAASGLSVASAGGMTLRLLPRPTLEILNVALAGDGGAVLVDADALTGRIGWADLLHGHFQVHSSELDRPTVTLDVDRLLPLLTALAGRDGAPAAPGVLAFLQSDGLTLRAGVVRLTSRNPRHDTLITDLSATLDWPRDASSASVVGQATWRGATCDFNLSLDTPEEMIAGHPSAAVIRVISPILDLTADGTLQGGGPVVAKGRLGATTADLAAFLRVMGTPSPQLAAFHSARLSGNATVSTDTLSLSEVQFGLDDMTFEGAMAFHDHAGRPGLVGTLATESMNLNPFIDALPTLGAVEKGWSSAAFNTRSVADDDIDLRISAAQAKVGDIAFEDGSLSVQSGNGRMELSLGEARAYDGLLKGRLVATLRDGQTDVRAEATVSRLDLTALARDVAGSDRLHGVATGHITLEGRGSSPVELIHTLTGQGQLSIRNGEVDAALFDTVIKPGPFARRWTSSLMASESAAFDSASLAFSIDQGQLSLGDSEIRWPSLRAWVTGSASIPRQTADLRAIVSPVRDDAGQPAAPSSAFGLAGSWRDLRLKPERVGF